MQKNIEKQIKSLLKKQKHFDSILNQNGYRLKKFNIDEVVITALNDKKKINSIEFIIGVVVIISSLILILTHYYKIALLFFLLGIWYIYITQAEKRINNEFNLVITRNMFIEIAKSKRYEIKNIKEFFLKNKKVDIGIDYNHNIYFTEIYILEKSNKKKQILSFSGDDENKVNAHAKEFLKLIRLYTPAPKHMQSN